MFSADARGLLRSLWDRKVPAKVEGGLAKNKSQTRLVDKLSQKYRPDTISRDLDYPTLDGGR